MYCLATKQEKGIHYVSKSYVHCSSHNTTKFMVKGVKKMTKRTKGGSPTDLHHRKPRSRGGTNSSHNVVRVCRNKHRAWHRLFMNYDPKQIAKIITDTYMDPDYYMVAIPRHKKCGIRHHMEIEVICECGRKCTIRGIPKAVVKKGIKT